MLGRVYNNEGYVYHVLLLSPDIICNVWNVICTGVGLGFGNETNHMLAANHNFKVKYRLGSIHKTNPSVDYTCQMRS